MIRIQASMTDAEILDVLGSRLAALREQSGLTLEKAAREAGLHPSTVWRAEAGRGPNLLTVVRLLRVYGRLGELSLMVPDAPPSPLRALESSERYGNRSGTGARTRSGPRSGSSSGSSSGEAEG